MRTQLRTQLCSERNHYAERQAGFMQHTDSQKREIERLKKHIDEFGPREPSDPELGRVKVTRKQKPWSQPVEF